MTHRGKAPESGRRNGKPSGDKVVTYSVLLLLALFVFGITAIAHKFGPYMGKVVDLETGAPIEGAAVLIRFSTESFFASGAYADAVETLTDHKGEFRIPWYLATTFHPISKWKPNGYVTIFKPGYGAYPGHRKALPRFEVGGTLPENKYVTIRLPRLKTIEERKRNLISIYASVPDRKMRNLLRLESQERVNVGITPYSAKRLGLEGK